MKINNRNVREMKLIEIKTKNEWIIKKKWEMKQNRYGTDEKWNERMRNGTNKNETNKK